MKSCPGKFCNGKLLALSRFTKDKRCKACVKTKCKMCVANEKRSDFVSGICETCKSTHDCSFGSGRFCNRKCAMGKTNAVRIAVSNSKTITTKVCASTECPFPGLAQTVNNFYPRKDRPGRYRSYCKTCSIKMTMKSHTTFEGFVNYRLVSAKNRAIQANRDFELTNEYLQDLWNRQESLCAISGTKMTHKGNDTSTCRVPTNGSLDRIDSSKGYVKGNVQWVCNWIQSAKSDYNQVEFVEWILSAANYIQSKR